MFKQAKHTSESTLKLLSSKTGEENRQSRANLLIGKSQHPGKDNSRLQSFKVLRMHLVAWLVFRECSLFWNKKRADVYLSSALA